MSNPIVNLNVRANTARAMADFKKFSDSLNNKFLVSGLKVDLITSTLKQINSEFQKSIGEQGLLGASSIRAAQNQAALLTSTFKGFGLEASKSINANMTKALSDVAVKAGGTMADIKKTMGAVPFISANLTGADRTNLARQILSFQRDLRRSGISEEGAAIGQKFLSGQTNVQDMINSPDAITSRVGMTMANKGVQLGTIFNAEARTQALKAVMEDPELKRFLGEQAKQTSGFKLYIEDLNTKLFNPESGLFGALRKVKMSATRTTNVFDETDRIINSVFGPRGIFIRFFQRIAQSFKISDPLKFIIIGMDFLEKQIGTLLSFIESPKFQQITEFVKKIFDNTWNVFKGIYDQVVGGNFDSTEIVKDLKDSGTGIRQFIRNIGSTIRGENIDSQADFGTSIISTLVEETGKTVVTLIQEMFKVFIDKAPGIAAKALPAMSKAFNNIMTQMFGGLAGPIKMLMNFLPGPLGMVARTANATSIMGAGSPLALAGIGAAAFAPALLGGLRGGVGLARTGVEAARRIGTFGPLGYLNRRLFRDSGSRRWRDDRPGGGGPGGGGPDAGGGGPRITQTLREILDSGEEGGVLQYGSVVPRPVPPPIRPPSFGDRLQGRDRARPPGFMDRVRRRRKFKLDSQAKLEKWGNLPGYSHPIGPIPDLGLGNGPNWALNLYKNYDYDEPSNNERLPILGALNDEGDDAGFVSRTSTSAMYPNMRDMRYKRRFSKRARFGRFVNKNRGKFAALAGVGLTAGTMALDSLFRQGNAAETLGVSQENAGKMSAGGTGIMNVLGAAAGGAQAGAIFGPWGMAIGGLLGAGVSLLDKGTKDGVVKFVSGFGNMVGDWIGGMGNAFNNTMKRMSDGLSNWVRGLWDGLTSKLGGVLDIFNIFKRKENEGKAETEKSWFDRFKDTLGLNYDGLNDSGSSLSMEARMSGNRAFMTGGGNIANNGEIIIPAGGMGRLVDALETRMSNRSSQSMSSNMIELSINVNNPIMLGDSKELIDSLRGPVLDIVNDAYKSIVGNKIRNSYVS